MTLKLLYVTTIASTLRAFFLPYAEHFRNLGWQVDAMAHAVENCEACRDNFDQLWEVDWSRNPLASGNIAALSQKIRRIVARESYDIIHVHTPVAAFITRFSLRGYQSRLRPQIIYTAHGFHFYQGASFIKNALFLSLERLAGQWMNYLIVINQQDKQAAIKNRILPEKRIVYLPGVGIDTEKYDAKRISAQDIRGIREELMLDSSDSLFLMIAEFNPGKRHEDALKALNAVGDAHIHLAMAGTGPCLNKMRNLAQRLGLMKQVHFLGFREDIPRLIKTSAALILPSEREGLPRSIMESLSMGVPVIGTDIRGIHDLVGEECGMLVKVGDVPALSDAMQWMLKHPVEAKRMGENGCRKMKGVYELKLILKAHEILYDRALREAMQ